MAVAVYGGGSYEIIDSNDINQFQQSIQYIIHNTKTNTKSVYDGEPIDREILVNKLHDVTSLPSVICSSIIYDYYQPLSITVPQTYIDRTNGCDNTVVYTFDSLLGVDLSGRCGIQLGKNASRCDRTIILKCEIINKIRPSKLFLCEIHAIHMYNRAKHIHFSKQ